ncbi:MAG TPA: ABC transporter transmembrane domain-containing protein [Opitutaceae bacterium]
MSRRSAHPHRAAIDRLPKAKLNRESLREAAGLFAYVLPYRGWFAAGMLALTVGNAAGLCFPFLAGALIDAALTPGGATVPVLGALPLDQVALVLAGTVTLQACAAFLSSLSFNRVGQKALIDLRRDTYSRLISLPMAFFSQRRVGELTSRISADIGQIEGALIFSLPQMFRQAFLLVGGTALIAITSGRLTLIMLSTLPILIAAAVYFGRKMRVLARETQDRLAETGTIVEETLQGIASVKAFANEAYEQSRYQRINESVLTLALRTSRWRAGFNSLVIASLFGGIVVVLWNGARLLQLGEITAGELTRFVLYTTFVAGAMGQAAELFSQIQKTVGSTQRVRELLREPTESGPSSETSVAPGPRLQGEVEFRDVVFRYPSRADVIVLNGISLHAAPGEKIALVGPSGAGKSTLTALLLRFYDPDSGALLIDGQDARDYPLPRLRSQLAIVPQDVLLFGGSIAENIGYGKPGASEEEIRQAARLANADDFITGFPDGYATVVGDRGIKLSGGQRQRVAIARAILKNPAILILDEATSSLDSESEHLVQEALNRLMKGRTTFIVAHRLATIREADRIAVIDAGRVVELGTHEQLSARDGGLYRRLSELQFRP